MMKLWLLEQNVNNGYDTYDSAVVVAATEDEARRVEVGTKTWAPIEHVRATLIGEAASDLEGGTIVCASFNAG